MPKPSKHSAKKAVKYFELHGFIILNPSGNLWSRSVYWSKESAKDELEVFWGPIKYDPKKFRIVPASAKIVPVRRGSK